MVHSFMCAGQNFRLLFSFKQSAVWTVMVCQCKCIERHMQSKRSVLEDDETRGRSVLSLSPHVIVIK